MISKEQLSKCEERAWDQSHGNTPYMKTKAYGRALLKAVEAESTPVALLPIGCDITPSIKSTCGVNRITKREAKEYHPQIMRDAREALSTPPSTSYLEQWVADNFEVVAYYEFSEIHNAWYLVYTKPPQGKHKLLYARKD